MSFAQKVFGKLHHHTDQSSSVHSALPAPSATPVASVAATKDQAGKVVDTTHHVAEHSGVLENFGATFSQRAHVLAHSFGAKDEKKTHEPSAWETHKADIEEKLTAYEAERKKCDLVLANVLKKYEEKEASLNALDGKLIKLENSARAANANIPKDGKDHAAEEKYIADRIINNQIARMTLREDCYKAAKQRDYKEPTLTHANQRNIKLGHWKHEIDKLSRTDDLILGTIVGSHRQRYLMELALTSAAMQDYYKPRHQIEEELTKRATQVESAIEERKSAAKSKKHDGGEEQRLLSPVSERSDATAAEAEKSSGCCCPCWPFWSSKPAKPVTAPTHSSSGPGMKYGSADHRG